MQRRVDKGKQRKRRHFFPCNGQLSSLDGAEGQHQKPRHKKPDSRKQDLAPQIRGRDLQLPVAQFDEGIGQRPAKGAGKPQYGPGFFTSEKHCCFLSFSEPGDAFKIGSQAYCRNYTSAASLSQGCLPGNFPPQAALGPMRTSAPTMISSAAPKNPGKPAFYPSIRSRRARFTCSLWPAGSESLSGISRKEDPGRYRLRISP